MVLRTLCVDRSTVSFRVASLGLILAFIFHIVGYGLPRWFTIQITVIKVGFEGTYHMGLWQDCSCTPDCYCVARHEFKGKYSSYYYKYCYCYYYLCDVYVVTSG